MRRLLIPLLLLAACQKGSSSAPEGKTAAPAPADVIATVTFAHAATFMGHLGKYVDKVAPGAGARMDAAQLVQGFAAMTNSRSLEGIDLDKPVRLIVLDPKAHAKSPIVLLASFADVDRLRKGAGEVKVEAQDGRALVGADAEVAAVKSWALGSLAAQPAPDAPTAEVWIDRVMATYRADIEGLAKNVGAMNLGTTVQAVLQGEIQVLLAVGEQSERLFVTVEAADDDAALAVALAPKAGTTLAKFVAAQKPFDAKALAALPAVEHPAMLLVGHTELGELSEPMYRLVGPFVAQVAGKPFDDSFHQMWSDWLKHFTGDFAASSWIEAGGGTAMNELIGVDDGPATQKLVQGFLGSLATPKQVSFMGMGFTFSTALGAASHGAASIDTVAMSFDTAGMPPMQQEMFKRMYPDGMKLAFAGWGKTLGVSLGPKSLEQIGALIDGGGGKPPAAFVQGTLDASAKRKDSMVMVMDMAAMMAPLAQLPPSQSGMTWTMGFAGGRAELRMELPVAHVNELMAAFRTAGQPPR